MHVLVVDDEADPRELVKIVLVTAGLKVTAVEGVREAMEVLSSQVIDLLISDVGMPEIDGRAFVQRMRASESWSSVPAIALSGFVQPEDRMLALCAGFDAHFTKPWDAASLLDAVVELLTSKSRTRNGAAQGCG
jgi:CheY-like chemotaxis protein